MKEASLDDFYITIPEGSEAWFLREVFSPYVLGFEGALRILSPRIIWDSLRIRARHNRKFSTLTVHCAEGWQGMEEDIRKALLVSCFGKLDLPWKFSVTLIDSKEGRSAKANFRWKWNPGKEDFEAW